MGRTEEAVFLYEQNKPNCPRRVVWPFVSEIKCKRFFNGNSFYESKEG